MTTRPHYVSPRTLLEAIRAYRLDPVNNHEDLGRVLLLMADRIWGMFPVAHYQYCREDAIQSGIVYALVKLPNFDERRGSPFTYVTGSIRMGIMQHLKKEARIQRHMTRYHDYMTPLRKLHAHDAADNHN